VLRVVEVGVPRQTKAASTPGTGPILLLKFELGHLADQIAGLMGRRESPCRATYSAISGEQSRKKSAKSLLPGVTAY
jgi:hypothetical protein